MSTDRHIDHIEDGVPEFSDERLDEIVRESFAKAFAKAARLRSGLPEPSSGQGPGSVDPPAER